MSDSFDLRPHEITVADVGRNLPAARLVEDAIRFDRDVRLAETGALVAYSGSKTGRSPKDKHIVRDPASERDIWWGSVNIPIEHRSFEINRRRARDYLNTRDRLYCFDGFGGWDPRHRVKIRVICARPYHALFMANMLIRPTPEELAGFGTPDYVIYNAGQFPANPHTTGMTSRTSIDLSFEDREMVILGSEYAGEMKKGVFTVMNYVMPSRGVLSMHCSATADRVSHRSSLMFGLSGTGKTTLSADPNRLLIGDDEHCWSDDGIFNIEGGCYAKTIDLAPESEPDIFQALHFGAVLENVVLEPDREVDFHDSSITENTRGAYPISYIRNALIPCIAGHPTDVIFLTCDAFGVLPPVSRLTAAQAMYHFISGYTAKVAGTEVGVTEPSATFSPCFGGPFLVWHPSRYAELLAQRLKEHNTHVWLINTGWSGGSFGGGGKRMKLPITRAIVDAIHQGSLRDAPVVRDPVFGLDMVVEVPGVSPTLLRPRSTWADADEYDAAARRLAALFRENFRKYESGVSAEVRDAGPAG
ncbi:MAG: phosphoenolpyruvate carboxykinase (ATP) [Limisphaerales bacterium]